MSYIEQMFKTLLSEERVSFPELEMSYSNAHREIHNAINAALPDHKVGVVRDVTETGKDFLSYEEVYREIYFDRRVNGNLIDVPDIHIGKMLYSYIAMDVFYYTDKGIHGAVISNALHDAYGDLFEDHYNNQLSKSAVDLRIEFRKMDYRYRANNFGELSEYNNHQCSDKEIQAIIRQLEIDIGISSKVFFGETMLKEN